MRLWQQRILGGALTGLLSIAFAGMLWADPFAAVFPKNPDFQFEPPEAGSYRLNHLKAAPSGTVVDINGQTHDLGTLLRGKITLVSFVYLNCGDANGCPLASSLLFEIHDASAKLPQIRDKVQLMTISFDPARDTVEAMRDFAHPITSDPQAQDKIDWQVLTTTGPEELKPILDGFGQAIGRAGDHETINHLLRLYLVDEQGDIRNVYGLGLLDPRLLMTDVETLLMDDEGNG